LPFQKRSQGAKLQGQQLLRPRPHSFPNIVARNDEILVVVGPAPDNHDAVAAGPVCAIDSPRDIGRFVDGAILVTRTGCRS
jgi:hypothetical protein